MPCIIALDQSTSATKALIINELGQCLDRESCAHQQHYPQPGWVEHDAEEIWQNVLTVTANLIARNQQYIADLVGISITNQRETIVVFDRATGKPLHPAIVWQCRRSEAICAAHNAAGKSAQVHSLTGLRIDPYFSASKVQWLLENKPEIKAQVFSGEAIIGTIDSYLIYRLTQGNVFATDSTNASRTLLYDIVNMQWSEELCAFWSLPSKALPEVRDSEAHFGESTFEGVLDSPLPIVGVMGDSQASLFAQRCFKPGAAKVTFGTGSSVLLNIGSKPLFSELGVMTTLAWVRAGKPSYAFEGIIINSAATLEWLKNQLGLVSTIAEIETLAGELSDTGGVYLVPAFSGLGLPHWKPSARAAIVGLTGHSERRQIIRAALESIAYQLRDAIAAMQGESNVQLTELKADGGPTANRLLMQFTADITQVNLAVSTVPDCSALGSALMGFLGLKVYQSLETITSLKLDDVTYQPKMSESTVREFHAGWHTAVSQVLRGIQN